MSNTNKELVPWCVVFLVLFAIIFLCSSFWTIVDSNKKKKGEPLSLVAGEYMDTDDLGIRETLMDDSGFKEAPSKSRLQWLHKATQMPVEYLYSDSQWTR